MQILLIEDNPDHAELVQETLHAAYPSDTSIAWRSTLNEGLIDLKNNRFDLFLCDLKLPDSNIEATIISLQNLITYTPIIVLTSLDDEEVAKLLIHTGVQDYIPKESLNPELLLRVCNHSIERKKQTVELEQRNTDQARFCFSLCHDFKEPIRKISTMLSMLKEDLGPKVKFTSENKWCFDSVQKNTASLITLIDGLYEYLSLENNEVSFGPVNLNKILEQIETQFIASDIQADIKYDSLPTIDGIHSQLLLLFKNIISNGIKYNARNPIIQISHTLNPAENTCIIIIKDNGIGMKSKYLDEIFSPFKRLHSKGKYPGTGLGLSIAKRVVEHHLGEISVDSELGIGSIFTLSLPIKKPAE